MNLPEPITYTHPSVVVNGETITFAPQTITEFNFSIIDNKAGRRLSIRWERSPKLIVLFEGEAYDAQPGLGAPLTEGEIGKTMEEIAAPLVVALMGENPAAFLESLF